MEIIKEKETTEIAYIKMTKDEYNSRIKTARKQGRVELSKEIRQIVYKTYSKPSVSIWALINLCNRIVKYLMKEIN